MPQLLERMRRGVDEQIAQKGGIAQAIYSRAKAARVRKKEKQFASSDAIWLWLANTVVFPAIRKKMVGENLKALICGSAPLTPETQDYFSMLGIPVLQVYGLTETTGICTMDDPNHVVPGRVGPAISGIEMRLGDNDEIVVRGPNVFPGYWNRPQQTAEVLRDGWFHTGDQGEMDASGNWRIVGRIKNLIVLGSGHKIAPETIEEEIARHLPGAQQVVVVGNGRGYLSVIVTGNVTGEQVQTALDAVNPQLPHYKQVRAFSPAAGAILHRERNAHGERQAEARSDFRAHEERDRRHVSGEAGGIGLAQKGKALGDEAISRASAVVAGAEWSHRTGAPPRALQRMGSLSLDELENLSSALDDLEKDAHALILHSTLKCGFCAGADLRELYERSRSHGKAEVAQGVRDFLERIHRGDESDRCGATDHDCRGPRGDIWRRI